MELTCPKCHGPMRSYERSGIVVDQCAECRGVFLDRGELEKLIDAESHQVPSPAAASPAWGTPQPRYDDRRYDRDDDYGHRRRKKRSFLEDLFD